MTDIDPTTTEDPEIALIAKRIAEELQPAKNHLENEPVLTVVGALAAMKRGEHASIDERPANDFKVTPYTGILIKAAGELFLEALADGRIDPEKRPGFLGQARESARHGMPYTNDLVIDINTAYSNSIAALRATPASAIELLREATPRVVISKDYLNGTIEP